MNKRLKKSLQKSNRNGRILEIGKNNIELLMMDRKLRQVFPDIKDRLNYIDSLIEKFS